MLSFPAFGLGDSDASVNMSLNSFPEPLNSFRHTSRRRLAGAVRGTPLGRMAKSSPAVAIRTMPLDQKPGMMLAEASRRTLPGRE